MTIQKKVVELFGHSAAHTNLNWQEIVASQSCAYTDRACYKIRKSDPTVAIGSCSVTYGRGNASGPVVICPTRFTERRQIFADCLHLLMTHEPGNQLHILPEVAIPGGNVDYFVVSVRDGRVRDFAGIEIQTLDTTGTVWPARQRLLRELEIPQNDNMADSRDSYGMNWKMTAKTILVQMHHKIQTFQHLNKKLILVVQDHLLNYMEREFNFGHLANPAMLGDSMHIHAYSLSLKQNREYTMSLDRRLSTDAAGIEVCMGLQAEARVELDQIVGLLESRISDANLFTPF
ncbi:NotI family restriction endonuclease [Burkholderia aenigmatica]|uniref:NotI family restriction endonuclease n=1 Tax=Burkholderia aenigmatica TaxID=2015348 RepID=UPI0026559B0A|nr:NotI family restriction endonuclease [Burkholderia aenigmatica]MDN7880222.1 NotI family restriction endonuclease [Burkholderia aenigmatica]